MNPWKGLAQGFLAMTAVIWILNVIALAKGGDAWLGMLYFLILLIPLSSAAYLRFVRKKNGEAKASSSEKWSQILFSLQGVVLACWAYDLVTTYYAIDVARVATEINPLGWPLGAVGALVYYAPTVVLTYVLLFRIKQKVSFYTAIPITALSLYMGSMNLNAAIGNFNFFVETAWLATGTRYVLLATVAAVNLVFIAVLARNWLETLKQPLRAKFT